MDNAMAGTVGRPSEYDPAHCEKVVELGKQGMSVIEMACEIGVSRNTLETNWPAKHPEFLEAFTRAREESQAWWEKAGRVGMAGKNIDAAIWSRSMAARFPKDWREVKGTEVSGPDGGPINLGRVERVIIDPQDTNR
jgi:orotate phosphoribosyltransferase-like protein